MLGAAVAAVAALGLATNLGTELFPRVDAGQFQVLMRLPSGTRIERSEEMVARVEQVILEELGQPDPEYPTIERHPDSHLQMLISNIGVLMDWPAAYTPNRGPMDSSLLVQLKEASSTPSVFDVVTRLRHRLREDFPQAAFAFDTGGMLTAALNFGEPAPIHYQVRGSDLATLGEISGEIASVVARIPGVEDVRVLQRNDYPTIEVEIDRVKAALAGLTLEDVMHNLVTATNSSINFQPAFWIDERNGNHDFIGAQYPETDLISIDTLRDIPLTSAEEMSPIPLGTIAKIHRGTGPSFVRHRNITRSFDVYADVAPGMNLGEAVSAIDEALMADSGLGLASFESGREEIAYDVGGPWAGRGYTLAASGEIQTMRESFRQFGAGLLIAALLIYLVMVAQFRSFLDPLMILATVPLGFIGVAVAHRIQIARFEAGTGLGLEVIEAQNAEARARLSLVTEILRYNASQLRLLAASGLLDPDAVR